MTTNPIKYIGVKKPTRSKLLLQLPLRKRSFILASPKTSIRRNAGYQRSREGLVGGEINPSLKLQYGVPSYNRFEPLRHDYPHTRGSRKP